MHIFDPIVELINNKIQIKSDLVDKVQIVLKNTVFYLISIIILACLFDSVNCFTIMFHLYIFRHILSFVHSWSILVYHVRRSIYGL